MVILNTEYRKIRRRTLARQLSLYEMLSDYESLTESQQIQNMQHHLLSCGTNALEKLHILTV